MSSSVDTKKVLGTPLKINGVVIKNRIILGPMAVLRPTGEGPDHRFPHAARQRWRGPDYRRWLCMQ